jgi:hypothetical protein
MVNPRIYLDIDDVIVDFQSAYADFFGTKVQKAWCNSNLMKRRLNILRKQKEFWTTIPVKTVPNFIPSGYVSARSIPKAWSLECFKKYDIPGRSNIHHVSWNVSKIELLKELGVSIFIDDKYETFKDCNNNGIFCLLMDASTNQKYKTPLRIYDLDINNILRLYYARKV